TRKHTWPIRTHKQTNKADFSQFFIATSDTLQHTRVFYGGDTGHTHTHTHAHACTHTRKHSGTSTYMRFFSSSHALVFVCVCVCQCVCAFVFYEESGY